MKDGPARGLRPLSAVYGADRGQPIDRFYINAFLKDNEAHIRGSVLEVRDPEITRAIGQARVQESHVVDIDPLNDLATIIADLCDEGSLGTERFDCVLLLQTLQYLRDPPAALLNVWTSLKPGGSFFISVPCVSRLDPTSGRDADLWRFTPAGLQALVSSTLMSPDMDIESRGNVVSCAAFLIGLAAEDLQREELLVDDPDFPLVVLGRIGKPVTHAQ